ncbi:10012_t:CDS:2, partial [Funneliformis mosseae]
PLKIFNNYEHVDKMDAHYAFYKNLCSILDNEKCLKKSAILPRNSLKAKKSGTLILSLQKRYLSEIEFTSLVKKIKYIDNGLNIEIQNI